VDDFGASDVKETQLGKKKLAYPIKKTRNGHYVVVNFIMDSQKINELDAKIRTQDDKIIRYLIVNLDEHLKRAEKDKVVQSKIVRRPVPAVLPATAISKKEKVAAPEPLVEINQEELEKKIEEALSEDLTK
jgi:ribosomal protein S6